MKKLAFSAIATLMAAPAFAVNCSKQPGDPACQSTPVPEISALEGTAAIAAIAAILLLTWERRRRAA